LNDSAFFDLLSARGMQLTESQRRVIAHDSGRAAVYAGPGSGKTTVLTMRAAYLYLVRGVSPQRIAIFTFTRKSAAELRQRLAILDPALRSVTAGTFHSQFLRWLLKYDGQNPRLWTASEQREAMRAVLHSVHVDAGDESCEKHLQYVTQLKNRLLIPERIPGADSRRELIRTIYARYEESKERQQRWDYDDILVAFYKSVTTAGSLAENIRSSLDYMMIDEFQDTSKAQWLSVISLCKQHIPLLVVGDDDQSIYRFRGALPNMLRLFGQTYKNADEILLTVNFRSVDTIIRASSALIRHNTERRQKILVGAVGEGIRPRIIRTRNEWAEADYVAKTAFMMRQERGSATIAVLARSNRQLAFVSDALRRYGKVVGNAESGELALYSQPSVRAVLQVLRTAAQEGNDDARSDAETLYLRWRGAPASVQPQEFDRNVLHEEFVQWLQYLRTLNPQAAVQSVMELSWRSVSHATLRKSTVQQVALQLRQLFERAPRTGALTDWIQDIAFLESQASEKSGLQGVQILTFHAAKGLEFDCVFLIGLHDQAVPHSRAFEEAPRRLHAELTEEERRLLYVGLTRARRFLYLVYPRLAGKRPVGPSPFLAELGVTGAQGRWRNGSHAPRREDGAPIAAALQATGVPITGALVRHKIFGSGIVESVEIMQDTAHKIAIIFSKGDKRFFHWEMAAGLGHFEETPGNERGTNR